MSEETAALIPVEERQVDFYGDDITAALVEETTGRETIYVPLRPLCDYLELNWSSQLQRIKRDPVLSEIQTVVIINTVQGPRETICLPLEYLNGWLFGVNATRVKPELKDKVIRYQRDCYKVLSNYFQNEATVEEPVPAPSAALVQIREMGLAIAQMAEQQMELERSVNRAHSRLDQAAVLVKVLDQRLTNVEKKITPSARITDDQASEISQAVKALAEYLTTQDKSKNHYQSVFQEIYRRFGVSSYKNIRVDQFSTVLKFLEDWRQKELK
ncbi:MAG: hypothetical protein BGO39_03505 [Chloroflexi bacterium 54-19]|nr:MAG: hypothetical protein BGO39_03505 [Chloroflexi bacterium 54-19]